MFRNTPTSYASPNFFKLLFFLHNNMTTPASDQTNNNDLMIDHATERIHIQSYHDSSRVLELVMSDEFNEEGRSFGYGKDSKFEAIEKPDDTNQAIQFYNSSTDYVTTRNGSLVLVTKAVKTSWIQWRDDHLEPEIMTKNYTSGMIQSWNKFCFTGGILEMSIRLPGDAYSGGLWPAAWLMGQLSRATFQDTTMNVWPWSYDRCGSIDHLETRQKINACDNKPGFGFHPHQGRGAPEIDIFEVMPGHEMPDMSRSSPSGKEKIKVRPFMSTSLQIAPGVPKGPKRPINGHMVNESQSWYKDLRIGPSTKGEYNYWFWGQECGPEIDRSYGHVHKYMEDAISLNTFLDDTHFDNHHVYRIEWQPGPTNGYLDWYLDDELVFGINGNSLQELTGSMIPQEPMYLILNTAISHRWGMPEPCDIAHCPMCWRCYDCTNPDCQCTLPEGMKNCKNLPAEMSIDYIRLYQDKSDPSHTIGCSPEGFPTADYITANADKFANWQPYQGNFTLGDGVVQRLLRFVGIFGLSVIVIFALYRTLVWLYHRSNPYSAASRYLSFYPWHDSDDHHSLKNIDEAASLLPGRVTATRINNAVNSYGSSISNNNNNNAEINI